MIARFYIFAPFTISVPEGTQFLLPEYEIGGHLVRFHPPKRSEDGKSKNKDTEIKINGTPAIQTDLIHIDFIKDGFNREMKPMACDPPHELVKVALDFFTSRLRHATKASAIRPIDFPNCKWRLRYLNDDESELPDQEGFIKGRSLSAISLSWIVLTDVLWEEMHSLPIDYTPPPWEGLLLDAAIPGTPNGNSITLAATALEVFISFILDKLAANQAKPEELWTWVNNRSDHLKEPSVEEQYDKLLLILTGNSLKNETELWTAFKNLRSARNSFVHGGVARIGKANAPLDAATVAALVKSASLIIAKVREWIPPEIQWKQFDHRIGIEVSQKLSPSAE